MLSDFVFKKKPLRQQNRKCCSERNKNKEIFQTDGQITSYKCVTLIMSCIQKTNSEQYKNPL